MCLSYLLRLNIVGISYTKWTVVDFLLTSCTKVSWRLEEEARFILPELLSFQASYTMRKAPLL